MARAMLVLCSALIGLTTPATAHTVPKKERRAVHSHHDSATPRQIANSRAYERGDYYERQSSAHVFGSTSWWRMRALESGGGRR